MAQEKNKEEWLALGYDQGTYKHRVVLLDIIQKHSFETLLDVGTATGPDLALLRVADPTKTLKGFDQDPKNVRQAKESGLDVYEADLYLELPKIADKSFDVVLSNGVMMYVEHKCIKELVRIARKAVILSEKDPDGKILDYIQNDLGLAVTTTKITEEVRDSWKQDGYIYEIKL